MSSQTSSEDAAVITRHFVFGLLQQLPMANPGIQFIPDDIKEYIADHVVKRESTPKPTFKPFWIGALASVPPANGDAPLMDLPAELRRHIFAESLPAHDIVHHPSCKDDEKARFSSQNDPKVPPRRNRASDLMTLNKKISEEITEVLYEERFFAIHVHEGLKDGGIEFQDVGRQPLQYKDSMEDERFRKFGKDDQFGFHRLKKIIVQIHPTTEDNGRHTAINTYLMNLALCHLMERSGDKQSRITSLKIEFAKSKTTEAAVGRRAIQREHYWWDPDKHQPRETSVHNLPDVELVLRPFAILTNCHSVTIELPTGVRIHQPTVDFVSALEQSMKSKNGTVFMDDDLEMKIESARCALEDFVTYTIHGKGYHHVPKLTEEEMREDDGDFEGGSEDADDMDYRKHDLSPVSKNRAGDRKRLSSERCQAWATKAAKNDGWTEDGDDSDPEMAQVIVQSYRSARREETRSLEAVLAALLGDAKRAGQQSIFGQGRMLGSEFHSEGYTPTAQTSPTTTGDNSQYEGRGRTLSSAAGREDPAISTGPVSSSLSPGEMARARRNLPAMQDYSNPAPPRMLKFTPPLPATYYPSSTNSMETMFYGGQSSASLFFDSPTTLAYNSRFSDSLLAPNPLYLGGGDAATAIAQLLQADRHRDVNTAIYAPSTRDSTSRDPQTISDADAPFDSGIRRTAQGPNAPTARWNSNGIEIVDLTGDPRTPFDSPATALRSTLSSPVRGRLQLDDAPSSFRGDRQMKDPDQDEAQ